MVVYVYSLVNIEFFDSPLTTYNLFKEYAPILLMALPDDADHHHRRDRPLGVEHPRCLRGCLRRAGQGARRVDADAPSSSRCCSAWCSARSTASSSRTSGCPSLAVTIGTLALYRGLAEGLIQTDRIAEFPAAWQDWPTERIGDTDIPNIMIPVVILAVVFAVLLHFTSFGRGIYEIGLSSETAHFSGVNVARTKFLLFVMSGFVAALAGVYVMLRSDSVATDTGVGFELKVIASVLLGGVSIFGGRGALHGVIAGVLLIAVLNSALQLSNQGSEIIQIIIGLLLVVSVIASSFLPRIRELLPRRAMASGPTKAPVSGDESRKVRQ